MHEHRQARRTRDSEVHFPRARPLAASLIAAGRNDAGIEERIPEGYRAVAVNVDESTGVAYLVRPGCVVDVLVVMDIKRPDRKPETISRVLLQRVRVGAVGQTLSDATSDTGASEKSRSVTLIVPAGGRPETSPGADEGQGDPGHAIGRRRHGRGQGPRSPGRVVGG